MISLLTPEQVADALQIDVATLYKWRARSYGPAALKVGKYLRYRPADVEAFVASLEPSTSVSPFRRAG